MADIPFFDLAIIGGGINGAGIARDAAGRGLSVYLCEQGDLGSGASSASSKLIHGGLRYLEQYNFRLVREALQEREILLRSAPHLISPLRFVMPCHRDNRPFWLLWAGLKLYDSLSGASSLPRSQSIDLKADIAGSILKPELTRALSYGDAWVDDARLVILCALDAHERGAVIHTHTKCIKAGRTSRHWVIETQSGGRIQQVHARALVNAAGAQADELNQLLLAPEHPRRTRLVQGSHIIVPRLFSHNSAYVLQHRDNRIIFMLPYEQDFTVIGTTDIEITPEHAHMPRIGFDEKIYLLEAVNRYLNVPLSERDIISTYSGVRSLYDDGSSDAQKITRDYVLEVNAQDNQAPLLTVFGGKITTHRRLAEAALKKLSPFLGESSPWTEHAVLPGGDLPPGGLMALVADLRARHPYMSHRHLQRLARLYGTRAHVLLHDIKSADDLGENLGGDFTRRELEYQIQFEWARTIKDVLWRRTKLGLHLAPEQLPRLYEVMSQASLQRRYIQPQIKLDLSPL
jgi:glycerol-3-phosphate dehydrogenase